MKIRETLLNNRQNISAKQAEKCKIWILADFSPLMKSNPLNEF